MRRDDPNLPFLRTIAEALGDLREQVVFLGGAVAGLLVTDPLAEGVRATRDVDVVIHASFAHFKQVEARVAEAGFAPDPDSGVICRWVHRQSGVLLDLMPATPDVLGFTNRWYPFAIDTAVRTDIEDGLSIRVVSPVAFVATKLEAFADRGANDVLASHDIEDILNIVDGRESLVDEVRAAPQDVRAAIAAAFSELLSNPDFVNALPGLIAEPDRARIVEARLRGMSSEPA